MKNANLSNVKLIGSTFIAADLEGANLRSSQLDRVDLTDALLVNADCGVFMELLLLSIDQCTW
jgi:uncharacterized protein YjbI with pentapeptide repeats